MAAAPVRIDPPAYGWAPEAYVEETCPKGRPHPTDWLERFGEGWRLASGYPDHANAKGIPVAHGQIVSFATREDHGVVDVTIHADGREEHVGSMPEGSHYCGDDDYDTLADSFEEFVRFYAENMSAGVPPATVAVWVYTWTDARFRLVVEGDAARFEPAEALQ